MLKRSLTLVFAASLVSLTGCSSAAGLTKPSAVPTIDPTTAAASPTAQPTIASPWKVVWQRTTDSSVAINVAGFIDETHGIAVGTAGAVNYTSDGGKTWTAGTNDTFCRFGLDVVNAQTAWHCGNGVIGFSADGGQTWTVKGDYTSPDPLSCHNVSFLDDKTGWVANDKELTRIENGGTTATPIKLPMDLNGRIAAIQLRTANDGYVLDSGGTVWMTADAGKTWTSKALGLADDVVEESTTPQAAMRFSDATHGVIVARLPGDAPKLVAFRTADGGATWKTEQVGLALAHGNDITSVYLAHDGVNLTVVDTHHGVALLNYRA
jgi:photosystem II stability/assembly factor-like uncharacterized protein